MTNSLYRGNQRVDALCVCVSVSEWVRAPAPDWREEPR